MIRFVVSAGGTGAAEGTGPQGPVPVHRRSIIRGGLPVGPEVCTPQSSHGVEPGVPQGFNISFVFVSFVCSRRILTFRTDGGWNV